MSSRLIFQFLVIAVEIIFFNTKCDRISTKSAHESSKPSDPNGQSNSWSKSWRKLIWQPGYAWPISTVEIRQSIVPLVSAILGVILVSVAFSGKIGAYPNKDGECNTNLDADISGDGVRMSFWAQIAVLIIISIIGFFHQEDTGIKEVGGGLILTHISLVIALVVQMGRGTLTSVDAAIGATILDAQNMALQIPLTAKETLAARWQVILLIPTQILGLVVLPVLIVPLNKGDFASEDCKCLYVFWWSWLSDCSAFPRSELSVFWIYYLLRWITFIQSSFHSMYNAEWFHRSEKGERFGKPEPVRTATIQAGYLYEEYPATISWSFVLYALYSLTSMAVAEVTIRDFDLHPSSHIYSVGQIIAIVVAGATIIRAAWSFVRLINKEDHKSFPDLIFTLLWARNEDNTAPAPASRNDENQGGSNNDQMQGDPQGPPPQEIPVAFRRSRSEPLSPFPARMGRYSRPSPSRSRPRSSQSRISLGSNKPPPTIDGRIPDAPLAQSIERRHPRKPYEQRFRFKLRQPFKLEFVRRIYFPALGAYIEQQRELKTSAATVHNDTGSQERNESETCEPETTERSGALRYRSGHYETPTLSKVECEKAKPTMPDGDPRSSNSKIDPNSTSESLQDTSEDCKKSLSLPPEVLYPPTMPHNTRSKDKADPHPPFRIPPESAGGGQDTPVLPYPPTKPQESQNQPQQLPDISHIYRTSTPTGILPSSDLISKAQITQEATPPKKRALLIASPYRGLRGPENDVELMTSVLSRYEFEVTKCCGHDATRSRILDAWRKLISESSADDIAVIYYSGHGGLVESSLTTVEKKRVPEKPLRSQFLVPIDFDQTTEKDFRGILDIEISYMLRDTTNKTRNVTVILDCSYAARMARDPLHNDKAWPRNLPEIKHHSVLLSHTDRLRREGHLTEDTFVEGNPHAVRIAAAATSETAWEYQNLQGQPIGVLTEALATAIDKALDQRLSWRTVLLGVCEFVNRQFPQQHPRAEGPETHILFSKEHMIPGALLIKMEDGNAIIQGGRVASIHEGSIYDVMPFGSELVDKEKRLAEVKVQYVNGSKALAEITSGRIPGEGALAFLQKEALTRMPVSFPDDLPALGVRLEQSKFLRRCESGEEHAMIDIRIEGERLVVCKGELVLALHQFTDATMQAAIDDVVSDGERLARGHHFLTLGSGEKDEKLDHEVKIEFGRVDNGTCVERFEQDGTANLTENQRVYIKLRNGGRPTVFVSVFDVNVAGKITLVSNACSRGIELEPRRDYMLGRSQFDGSIRGLELSWPETVPKTEHVEETLVFVVSSEDVSLQHLADPNRSIEAKGGISRLEEITYCLVSGQARNMEPGSQGRCVRYAVHHIPFSFRPQKPVQL